MEFRRSLSEGQGGCRDKAGDRIHGLSGVEEVVSSSTEIIGLFMVIVVRGVRQP